MYYDPTDPSNAFLVREDTTSWRLLVIVVGAVLLAFVVLVFLGLAQPPSV